MKEILFFLIGQIESEIVILDNGTLEEVVQASNRISEYTELMRKALT